MPPEWMELWARRFEIKEGLLDSQAGSLALSLLPQGHRVDGAAAACVSYRMLFWMGRISWCSLGSGWPGRGWRGYSSLGVLEGTSSEAEACLSSKIL